VQAALASQTCLECKSHGFAPPSDQWIARLEES
jgi:hypothetical protein